jgi:hypothetical protein
MKRIRSNYHLHALKVASPRLRKAIVENSNNGLVLGIAEPVLNVLNGNCKISDASTKRMSKHKALCGGLSGGRLLKTRGS